jgi:hypothetical protein
MSENDRLSVLLVGLDGLGGYYLNANETEARQRMPTMFGLLDSATVGTIQGRTVFPPISAPAWVSALSGMTPDMTGVIHKLWDPELCVRCPNVRPGTQIPLNVFDALNSATTHKSIVASWSWLLKLVNGDVCQCALDAGGDDDKAVRMFKESSTYDKGQLQNSFTFVHLDLIDAAGHRHTWESEEYKASWSAADQRLNTLINTAQEHATSTQRDLVVIVVSDHGGSGHDHGDIIPSHMQIPLIVWQSPSNKAARAAPTELVKEEMSILDVTPTILALLGASVPRWARGTPLLQRPV